MTAIDIENFIDLTAWLVQRGLAARGTVPRLSLLHGGVSNKTVYVALPDQALVVKQALPKLRTSITWYSEPERIHREALALTVLRDELEGLHAPTCIAQDDTQHILAMSAVPNPCENLKDHLLAGRPPADLGGRLGSGLASLHRAALAHETEWRRLFGDTGFFEALRLEPYYSFSAARVPEAQRWLHQLSADCRTRRQTLVHGDFSPKNILLQGDELWLLDYEVIHWGDAAFDVGFCLAHWLSKALHLPASCTSLLAQADEFVCAVQAGSPFAASDPTWERYVVRHALACLLARVAGRSPLEYLTAGERRFQQWAVLKTIAGPDPSWAEFLQTWSNDVGRYHAGLLPLNR